MATIAEQLTSLANTKTAIKNAIVAKGVQVADTDPFSAYPDKIGQISSGGGAPATKFGASVDTWIGDVNENGVLQATFAPTTIDFSGVVEIDDYAAQYLFNDKNIVGIADLSSVKKIGRNGAYYMLSGNPNLEGVDCSSLEVVESQGLQRALGDCDGLTKLFFPALVSVASNGFGSTSTNYMLNGCSGITEIHFRADAQSVIEATKGYANKWGAVNATIYFSL